VIERPGLWKRSGEQGRLSGLDVGEALASLPADCDRDRARALLIAAEAPFLLAFLETKPTTTDEGAPNG
jgi:hypothetical protein